MLPFVSRYKSSRRKKFADGDSSYWLWATDMGGQVPCYSSLQSDLDPPPMPDTLAGGARTGAASTTTAGSSVPALTMDEKPTSAIVNVVFAMQYPMVPSGKPALKQAAKIGIGVGVSGAAIAFAILIWIVLRRLRTNKRKQHEPEPINVNQRFGVAVDMSRTAHGPAYVEAKSGGVTTRAVNF